MTDKAYNMFKLNTFPPGTTIIEEGCENDKLFIAVEGEFGVYKTIKRPNIMGIQEFTKSKIASITVGELFGENCLFTNHLN